MAQYILDIKQAQAKPLKNVVLENIKFYTEAGKPVTLKKFRGKVVLVNVWATWCPPCMAEMPALERLQKALPKKQFEVVAVSLDHQRKPKEVREFLKKAGVKDLKVYFDHDSEVTMKWSVDTFPASYLLDRKGKVVKWYTGPYEWDKTELPEIESFIEDQF